MSKKHLVVHAGDSIQAFGRRGQVSEHQDHLPHCAGECLFPESHLAGDFVFDQSVGLRKCALFLQV
ncbi:MAG: hypothetical protein ABIH03_10565, partial [Pseudomonadota bacterium]